MNVYAYWFFVYLYLSSNCSNCIIIFIIIWWYLIFIIFFLYRMLLWIWEKNDDFSRKFSIGTYILIYCISPTYFYYSILYPFVTSLSDHLFYWLSTWQYDWFKFIVNNCAKSFQFQLLFKLKCIINHLVTKQ